MRHREFYLFTFWLMVIKVDSAGTQVNRSGYGRADIDFDGMAE